MSEPQWKLCVYRVSRWNGDISSFFGWMWKWEVRKWCADGYYPADLWGYKGSTRNQDVAIKCAEAAYRRMTTPKPTPPEVVWYHNGPERAAA